MLNVEEWFVHVASGQEKSGCGYTNEEKEKLEERGMGHQMVSSPTTTWAMRGVVKKPNRRKGYKAKAGMMGCEMVNSVQVESGREETGGGTNTEKILRHGHRKGL
ncbi:hypothetical protein ACSQ67_006410 [Phaseolus vulgaris]